MRYNPSPRPTHALRSMRSESDPINLPTSGQRGPADHDRRAQIISVANGLFREFGYRKTSVADIGKAMGISAAYVYRFFTSKQAIGEAICAVTLEQLGDQLREVIGLNESATKRFRLFMRTALKLSYDLLVIERGVNEVVVAAIEGDWCTVVGHKEQLHNLLEKVILDGRQAGEFEKKTPLDEVIDGLAELILPYTHESCIGNRTWDELEKGMLAATNLALRSLAF